MQEEKWEVRKAKLVDVDKIVEMAGNYPQELMPYLLNGYVVGNYIDQFMVAENSNRVGGAVHYITRPASAVTLAETDRVDCFLLYVKQVPSHIIVQFRQGGNIAFLCHVLCPGKGSFYAILEELKEQFDELWCWMSVIGPSYESYRRYGFTFYVEREFWNVYKCGYSRFVLGKWRKE